MMWHKLMGVAFDLETTGVDVENDRIVTGAVIGTDPMRGTFSSMEWLADPGVEIPTEAFDVHGISTEHARAEGEPARDVVDQIAEALAIRVRMGDPVIGHNVPFDLTLLDRELRRYERQPLHERLGDAPLHVIDTRVLDQRAVPYRKRVSETQGARQLITLAQFYGLEWDEEAAHGCTYDALAAAEIARRIGILAHMPRRDWPENIRAERRVAFIPFRDLTLAELHAAQIEWAAEQAAGLQKHFRKSDPNAVVDGTWPLRPWVEPSTEGVPA